MVLLTDTAGNAIELFGWLSPSPTVRPPEHKRFTSVGLVEVALIVDDIDAAEKRLNDNGYSFRTPLAIFAKGEDWFGGMYAKIRYVLDPDDVQVELLEFVEEKTS